jgi:hypothetical protein
MTHINAYAEEVEKQRIALENAQSNFDAAVAALQAKEDELYPTEGANFELEELGTDDEDKAEPKAKKAFYR